MAVARGPFGRSVGQSLSRTTYLSSFFQPRYKHRANLAPSSPFLAVSSRMFCRSRSHSSVRSSPAPRSVVIYTSDSPVCCAHERVRACTHVISDVEKRRAQRDSIVIIREGWRANIGMTLQTFPVGGSRKKKQRKRRWRKKKLLSLLLLVAAQSFPRFVSSTDPKDPTKLPT